MQKVRLGDVGTIITGNTPKTSEKNNYSSKDICFVKPSDILEDEITIIENSEFYISEYARNKSRILPINSVLVTCIGIIGKVAINKKECAFNQQINAIIPDTSKCLPQYLAYAIQFNKRKMQDIANAPVVPIMNKAQFSDVIIKLLSIEQQKRIADELDKITHLITLRKRQLTKLDELVKSRFVEMFGDPIENPMNWPKAQLGTKCTITTGNTPPRANSKNYGNFIEWIKSDNIVDGRLTNAVEYLSEEGFVRSRYVEPGAILMTCIAGSINSIGNCAMVNRRVAFNQQLNAIMPGKEYDGIFLLWLFRIAKIVLHMGINKCLKGILSKGNLSKKEFPLPPLALQREFAAFVVKADKLALKAKASLEKLETLKKAMMQKYFN